MKSTQHSPQVLDVTKIEGDGQCCNVWGVEPIGKKYPCVYVLCSAAMLLAISYQNNSSNHKEFSFYTHADIAKQKFNNFFWHSSPRGPVGIVENWECNERIKIATVRVLGYIIMQIETSLSPCVKVQDSVESSTSSIFYNWWMYYVYHSR